MEKKKIVQLSSMLAVCLSALILTMGCSGGCHKSGTDQESFVEYSSCAGPGAICGFGCNSKCWPTECLTVKYNKDGMTMKGSIKYYNGTGCIGGGDNTEYSVGTYRTSTTCALLSICGGKKTVEEITEDNELTYTTKSCLGCTTEKNTEEMQGYNNSMPRQYRYGCYSSEK